MAPIERAFAEDFFPALFGELDPGEGKEMRELWGHSAKRAGLGIPDPMVHAEHCHHTSMECCSILVESILGKEALEHGAHRQCVRLGSWSARQIRQTKEMVEVGRR
eukprot:10021193-Ditylum_brightwellii.AAC.1